ncbi:hypothetical protein PINS_up019393 [Pythium insidiosum]|nr:hypothetical protein PINS_up019393 [Pythium insidiosum]
MEPRLQPAYKKFGHKKIPFRGVDRIKLILNIIIKSHLTDGGCALNLEILEKNKCLVASFRCTSTRSSRRSSPSGSTGAPRHGRAADPRHQGLLWRESRALLCMARALHDVADRAVHRWHPAVHQCRFREDCRLATLVPYFGLFMALWSTYVACVQSILVKANNRQLLVDL